MRLPFPTLLSCQKLPYRTLVAEASESKHQWQHVLSHYRQTKAAALPVYFNITIPTIFKACANLQSVKQGISVHADVIKLGFDSYTSTGNSIMSFYMKCGMMDSALLVLDGMTGKDSVSWNAAIHGVLSQGDSEFGLDLFMEARVWGFVPNVATLVLVLQACWRLDAISDGLNIHGYIIKSGFSCLVSIQNSLLSLYVKSQDLIAAQRLFDEMPERDVISWSALISGYAQNGAAVDAWELFREMSAESDVDVDGVSMVSVLQACSSIGSADRGRLIHGQLIRRGLEDNLFVGNSLIDMYSKCFDVESACITFNEMSETNIVSWNSFLSGLVHNEKHLEALELFDSMKKAGLEGDEVTTVNLLQVCKRLGEAAWCKCIHSVIIRRLFEQNLLLLNSLLDAYAKCDLMGLALKLFEQMGKRNVVSWSTMISGFAHCGQPDEAVAAFREMLLAQEKANLVAMLSLLEACGVSAELKLSKCAHGVAVRNNLATEVAVGTALLDMYAKCGDVNASRKVFDKMPERNILSWNAMIGGLGINGCAEEALALLHDMESENLKPNAVTMLSLLSACSHGGLVEQGLSCLQRMMWDPLLQPGLEHYSCVVDMLGRAGQVEGAFEAIRRMPEGLEASPAAWGALLSACRNQGNWELGHGVASRVLELEPSNAAGYLLSSSLFAKEVGLQGNNARRMRLLMRERGVRVASGYSLVHVDCRAHKFAAWDVSHPQSKETYSMVELLHSCMKKTEKNAALITN